MWNRLRQRAMAVAALGLAIVSTAATGPASAAGTATVVRVIRTSAWAEPSTDPTGLACLPNRNALVVADSEVEETERFAGVNVWFATPRGRVLQAFDTLRFSTEPADVAVGRDGKVLFFSDDGLGRIYVLRIGRDEAWGTDDDRARWFSSRGFGSADPSGLGFGAGSLFITDGDNGTSDHAVYRLRPGKDGRFDGVTAGGDDVVTSFDTEPVGISRPSDVAFDESSRHLFLVSAMDKVIVETTLAGREVMSYDVSSSQIRSASGITLALGSASAGTHVNVADRGRDNDGYPHENDGRIFEFELA
jgi:hypothetical protein